MDETVNESKAEKPKPNKKTQNMAGLFTKPSLYAKVAKYV